MKKDKEYWDDLRIEIQKNEDFWNEVKKIVNDDEEYGDLKNLSDIGFLDVKIDNGEVMVRPTDKGRKYAERISIN